MSVLRTAEYLPNEKFPYEVILKLKEGKFLFRPPSEKFNCISIIINEFIDNKIPKEFSLQAFGMFGFPESNFAIHEKQKAVEFFLYYRGDFPCGYDKFKQSIYQQKMKI